MRAAYALIACTAGLGGCSAIDGVSLDGQRTLDPSTIYLASFEQVETTRNGVDELACLSGSPVLCNVYSTSVVECWCPY